MIENIEEMREKKLLNEEKRSLETQIDKIFWDEKFHLYVAHTISFKWFWNGILCPTPILTPFWDRFFYLKYFLDKKYYISKSIPILKINIFFWMEFLFHF